MPSVQEGIALGIDASAGGMVFGRALAYANQIPRQLGVNVGGQLMSYAAVAAASVATVALTPVPRQVIQGRGVKFSIPNDDKKMKIGATGILISKYLGGGSVGFNLMMAQHFVKL